MSESDKKPVISTGMASRLSQYETPILQNSLQKHIVSGAIVSSVSNQLNGIPNIENLKLDLELTMHVMKLIEVYVKNHPSQSCVDKKTVLLSAFKQSFPNLSDVDLDVISNQIDFICNNNMIIITKKAKNLSTILSTPFRSVYKYYFPALHT